MKIILSTTSIIVLYACRLIAYLKQEHHKGNAEGLVDEKNASASWYSSSANLSRSPVLVGSLGFRESRNTSRPALLEGHPDAGNAPRNFVYKEEDTAKEASWKLTVKGGDDSPGCFCWACWCTAERSASPAPFKTMNAGSKVPLMKLFPAKCASCTPTLCIALPRVLTTITAEAPAL